VSTRPTAARSGATSCSGSSTDVHRKDGLPGRILRESFEDLGIGSVSESWRRMSPTTPTTVNHDARDALAGM
jgi:hypothetical protein